MSNLREKAREIKAAGVAERGNFQPHGAPLKAYKYWASETKPSRVPKRENFCHFWRVVAIWAPIMFLKNTLLDFADTVVGKVVISALLLSLLTIGGVMSRSVLVFILTVIGVALVIYGILVGGVMSMDEEWTNKKEKILITTSFYVLLPISGPVFGSFWLAKKIKASWNAKVERIAQYVVVSLMALILIGFITLLVVFNGFIALLILLGVLAAASVFVLALFFIVSYISDYISGRRALKREAAYDAEEKYYEEFGYYPSEAKIEPREPGIFSKFFTGIGDFIVFVAQIVRVKKWKICPIVDITE